jgi:hypothetical protein
MAGPPAAGGSSRAPATYAGARGGGLIVGTFYDGGIVDQYEGSLVY